jgi:hypothetical protein
VVLTRHLLPHHKDTWTIPSKVSCTIGGRSGTGYGVYGGPYNPYGGWVAHDLFVGDTSVPPPASCSNCSTAQHQ